MPVAAPDRLVVLFAVVDEVLVEVGVDVDKVVIADTDAVLELRTCCCSCTLSE